MSIPKATNIQIGSVDNSVDFFPLENDEEYGICSNSWKDMGLVTYSGQYIKSAEPDDCFDRLATMNVMVYKPDYLGLENRYFNMREDEIKFYIDRDRWMDSSYINGTVVHPGYGTITKYDERYNDSKPRILHQKYSGTTACYRYLLGYLHGRRFAIRMRREGIVYIGRVKVNSIEQDPTGNYSTVSIGYMLEPNAVDAADLGLKYVVNWYDYDGTLIYTELVPVGSTPTTPTIPELDPEDPDNPGTDPTAGWDTTDDPTDPDKPIDGNEEHHVVSGTIIVDYGGYVTDKHTGRAGNRYKIVPGWIERPAMGSDPIDATLPAAFWIMAFPKAYGENKDPTIEGVFVKGTTRIYVEYIEAISYDNALAPQPSNLTIGNVDNYSYDSETQTLYFY